MAFVSIPVRAALTSSMFADINQLSDNCDYCKAQIELNDADILALQTGVATQHIITADYDILDGDGYNIIHANPTTGDIVVGLPTLADNPGRRITIKVSHAGGKVTIDGEGAEKIDGDASVYLQGIYDCIKVVAGATEWHIIPGSLRQTWKSGWLTCSDWSVRHLSSCELTYDNLGGAGFTIGEWIEDQVSGARGIIMADSGTVLKLKNVSGVFAENNQILGDTSAETADVDTPLPKNTDGNIHHDFAKNLSDIVVELFLSSDGTEANALLAFNTAAAGIWGLTTYQIDTDNIKIQTATDGWLIVDDAGDLAAIDNDDWFYQIVIRRVI